MEEQKKLEKKEYFKNYYKKNKERIIEMIKEKRDKYKRCECGCVVKDLQVHRKSKKHIRMMESDNVVDEDQQIVIKRRKRKV